MGGTVLLSEGAWIATAGYFFLCVGLAMKETAAHSSVLAWRILGMGEPSGLPSMGSHRVGHD